MKRFCEADVRVAPGFVVAARTPSAFSFALPPIRLTVLTTWCQCPYVRDGAVAEAVPSSARIPVSLGVMKTLNAALSPVHRSFPPSTSNSPIPAIGKTQVERGI